MNRHRPICIGEGDRVLVTTSRSVPCDEFYFSIISTHRRQTLFCHHMNGLNHVELMVSRSQFEAGGEGTGCGI